jgi:flagellar motor switch protein FliM
MDETTEDASENVVDSGEPVAAADAVLLYNFGRSGQISNDQMRAIAMVNDGIARNLTHTLGAWLRSQVQVGLAATEQLTYSDFLASLPEPAYLGLLRLEPLGGTGLMQLDLSLAMTIIDVLLGGKGAADQVRDVTDIEQEILGSVLSVVMRELNAAWEAVGLRFTLEKREAPAQVTRLMPASERMLVVSLDVQMQDVQGTLKLCLPAVVLNTIHRRLIAVKEQPRRNFDAGGARVTELMGNARFKVAMRLPVARLSSREIRALTPGYIVPLNLPRNTQADMTLCGVPVGIAVPVGQGEHRAALMDRRAKRRPVVSSDGEYVATKDLKDVIEGEQVA